MHEHERTKLIGGPYRMPRCKVGRFLRCAVRGKVRVRGIHEAPIQWPYTVQQNGRGRPRKASKDARRRNPLASADGPRSGPKNDKMPE